MKKLLRLSCINGQAVSSLLYQILRFFQKSAISRDVPEKRKNPGLIPARFRNPLAGCSGKRHIGTTAIVSAFLLFWCLSACKEKDELPAPTQTGANTLGCYVDGRKWVPEGEKIYYNQIPGISATFVDNENVPGVFNDLFFILTHSNGETMHLYLKNCNRPGRYNFDHSTGIKFSTITPEYSYGVFLTKEDKSFVTNERYVGFAQITKADSLTGLVAGTFEFVGYSPTEKKSVRVSAGRFDINLKTLNP